MQELHFSTRISAAKEKVWHTMLDPEKYKQWAKAFSSDSQFEGEWKTGAYMKFIDPNLGGTKALLEAVEPFQRIHASHVAILGRDGKEDTESDFAKKWIGITETYTLRDDNGATDLSINIETHEDYAKMFNDGWPKAMAFLKDLCETS